jgi:hypothetical protein
VRHNSTQLIIPGALKFTISLAQARYDASKRYKGKQQHGCYCPALAFKARIPDTPKWRQMDLLQGRTLATMYLTDALERVRQRLVQNQARPETLRLVDSVMETAQRTGGDQAQVRSLLELVRRLMRTPVAHSNIAVYDDLAVLEEQLIQAAAEAAAAREAEESRPLPKPKKYYRQLREREREQKQREQR